MADHQTCVSRQECTALMGGLWDAIGRDEKSGLRSDVREIRDTQIAEKAVRDNNEKLQHRLLALLTIAISLSQFAAHWDSIKTIFTSMENIPHFITRDYPHQEYHAGRATMQDAKNPN